MSGWEQVGAIAAVLTPLIGVPLTAIAFYVRAARDPSAESVSDLVKRIDHLDRGADSLRQHLADLQRDATTKEEWLRECMFARRERRRLMRAVVRLQTEMESRRGVLPAAELHRATRAILTAADRIERALGTCGDGKAIAGRPKTPPSKE